jgi:hypothetical protein
MSKERRAAQRRGMTWQAIMIDAAGAPIAKCTIVDVSSNGAKLALKQPMTPPDSFVLVLSKNGGVRRRCEVTWRSDESIGVRFVRPQPSERKVASRFDAVALLAKSGGTRNGDAAAKPAPEPA